MKAPPVRLAPGAGRGRGIGEIARWLGVAATVAGLAGCEAARGPDAPGGRRASAKDPAPGPFRFTERAKEAGIDFVHESGMTEERHFPTGFGSGLAMFDSDGDGRLDLYFATGTPLPVGSVRSGPNRLYRNMGDGTFRDATETSGLGFAGYCIGVVVGDLDNDGDPDVYLTNYGGDVLYRNEGDGTFRDVTGSAGLGAPGFSMSGALLDYDGDGDLDLYVARYGDWKFPEDVRFCGDLKRNIRQYCSPRKIRTTRHVLYRNDGNLTFTDVTEGAGVGRDDGHGFGVVSADLDGDGRIDLYVANDMNPNFLFLNRGDGTFEDRTELSGAAFDAKGIAHSGMGVDAEDINGDGRPDLIMTNFDNEYNTLYVNLGGGLFADRTPHFALASATIPYVGWGCALADFDNDGWPDNFAANGQVDNNLIKGGKPVPYAEPPHLFVNEGGERFRPANRGAGPYFDTPHVGRGAAFGDLDDDGDLDIVVSHKDGPPALLRNDSGNDNRWVRLELQGTRSNRDAVGARVEAVAGGRTIHRQRKGGYGLESSNDPRILIGLGRADEVERLTVRWPSGAVSTLEHLEVNRTHRVVEPEGATAAASPPAAPAGAR